MIYTSMLLMLMMITSCTSIWPKQSNYILNPGLLAEFMDYNESLKSERPDLLFENGKTVTNCLSYFKMALNNEVDQSNYNQSIKSEYLNCEALKILEGQLIGAAKDKNDLGKALSEKLDVSSFPSSIIKTVSNDIYTLAALYPDATIFRQHETIYETEDWIFRLEVVAVVKLNDNKKQDWIVWLSDESKSGDSRFYSTLVVYDPGKQKSYIATPYPWDLKPLINQ